MRALRIHEAAAEEAVEAAAWYEAERPGLGADFHKAIDAALDLLEQDVVPLTNMPGIGADRNVRRLLLRRFPYAIVVQMRSTETVVIAVAHQARRPGYWRDRLKA